MSAFGSRQFSSSFIRIGESECAKPPGLLKDRGSGFGKRWSRRLLLKPWGDSNPTKRRSFVKRLRHSFNTKFTILSFILLVLLMPGSAFAAPVDPSSTPSSSASSTSSDSAATETGTNVGTVKTPTLFDTITISSNSTTTTCPAFFNTFLRDPDFLNCLPLSALLLVCPRSNLWAKQVGLCLPSPPRTRNRILKSLWTGLSLQLKLLTKHAMSTSISVRVLWINWGDRLLRRKTAD